MNHIFHPAEGSMHVLAIILQNIFNCILYASNESALAFTLSLKGTQPTKDYLQMPPSQYNLVIRNSLQVIPLKPADFMTST